MSELYLDELEDWSDRAAQVLQDLCDEAQAAAGNPDGEDQCTDIRALLREHDDIARKMLVVELPNG